MKFAVARSLGVFVPGVRKNRRMRRKQRELVLAEHRERELSRATLAAWEAEPDDACYWCGLPFTDAGVDSYRRTREHLVPRARGGGGTADNIAMAHALCNQKRGTSMDWVPFSEHGHRGVCYVRNERGDYVYVRFP